MDHFYDDHPIISNIVLILILFLAFLGFYFFPRYSLFAPGISVSKVLSNVETYDGKEITIRGYNQGPLIFSTAVQCEPPTCDCNTTNATHLILEGQTEHSRFDNEKSILVEVLNCKGDECNLVCEGFYPVYGRQYAFHGKLINHGYQIVLEDVNFEKSKQKTGKFWVRVKQLGGEIDLGEPGY